MMSHLVGFKPYLTDRSLSLSASSASDDSDDEQDTTSSSWKVDPWVKCKNMRTFRPVRRLPPTPTTQSPFLERCATAPANMELLGEDDKFTRTNTEISTIQITPRYNQDRRTRIRSVGEDNSTDSAFQENSLVVRSIPMDRSLKNTFKLIASPRTRRRGTPIQEIDRTWALDQLEELTTWANQVLQQREMHLSSDLRKSMSDGKTLPLVVSIVSSADVTDLHSEPADRKERLDNVQNSLVHIKTLGIALDTKAEEIIEGDLKATITVLSSLKNYMGQGRSRPSGRSSRNSDKSNNVEAGQDDSVPRQASVSAMTTFGKDGAISTPSAVARINHPSTEAPTTSHMSLPLPSEVKGRTGYPRQHYQEYDEMCEDHHTHVSSTLGNGSTPATTYNYPRDQPSGESDPASPNSANEAESRRIVNGSVKQQQHQQAMYYAEQTKPRVPPHHDQSQYYQSLRQREQSSQPYNRPQQIDNHRTRAPQPKQQQHQQMYNSVPNSSSLNADHQYSSQEELMFGKTKPQDNYQWQKVGRSPLAEEKPILSNGPNTPNHVYKPPAPAHGQTGSTRRPSDPKQQVQPQQQQLIQHQQAQKLQRSNEVMIINDDGSSHRDSPPVINSTVYQTQSKSHGVTTPTTVTPATDSLPPDAKYSSTKDNPRRLSMPVTYDYRSYKGGNTKDHIQEREDNSEGSDLDEDLFIDVEESDEGSRSATPPLPAFTDNTDVESCLSENQAPVYKYRRSVSASGKMFSAGIESFNKVKSRRAALNSPQPVTPVKKISTPPKRGQRGVVKPMMKSPSHSCGSPAPQQQNNGASLGELTEVASDEETEDMDRPVQPIRSKAPASGRRSSGRRGSRSATPTQYNKVMEDKLSKLERMYEDIVGFIGVDNRHSNNRHSIVSATSSQWSYSHKGRGRRGSSRSSSENKATVKRFQRIESHIITLARSVAHISSEMKTHHNIYAELERLHADLDTLKHCHLQNNGQIAMPLITEQPIRSSLTGQVVEESHSPEGKMQSNQRISKLTRFFGQEPPLMKMFLKQLGYEKYQQCFESEKIGMLELPYMSEEKLKSIGVPLGPRMRILQEAQSLTITIPQLSHSKVKSSKAKKRSKRSG